MEEDKISWCDFGHKFVHQSVKTYRSGNGKVFDRRNVCSCGCNTDWKDIVQKNKSNPHKDK